MTQAEQREELVKQLTWALNGRQAHISFEEAVKDIPFQYCGKRLPELPYSIWQLVEHIRIAQKDILEFSRDEHYQSPAWPDEYWPSDPEPEDEKQWQNALEEIKKDREAFIDLLKDPANDLYAPFPYGDGQNLLREAMLIFDHNAYHTGQIILLRRALGIYE